MTDSNNSNRYPVAIHILKLRIRQIEDYLEAWQDDIQPVWASRQRQTIKELKIAVNILGKELEVEVESHEDMLGVISDDLGELARIAEELTKALEDDASTESISVKVRDIVPVATLSDLYKQMRDTKKALRMKRVVKKTLLRSDCKDE